MATTSQSHEHTSLPPSAVIIEAVKPQIDGGRYAVKREVGDSLHVTADLFRDGHDKIAAVVQYRPLGDSGWRERDMHFVDNDGWSGTVPLDQNCRFEYRVQAFPDVYGTWKDEVQKKVAAGVDVVSEVIEGTAIVGWCADRADRADGEDAKVLRSALDHAGRASSDVERAAILTDPSLAEPVRRNRSRAGANESPTLQVIVDRPAARFAAWYEMFPRSAGTEEGRSATFREVEAHLPRVHAMGFDVLYFTPIHPIGSTNRKGRNNTLHAGPDDPGVPYAIGSDDGGHDAIEPTLGTLTDFRHMVAAAADHGLEIALDIALQASPDHPWAKEHPEWFFVRPDGTIKYAENPPKKYEDIYPINFGSSDWEALWHEVRRVILFWAENGVRTFRVDNPHTKPTVFWEWLIAETHKQYPDVIFLSEAFTRPKVMKALAKVGFAQSYTYFTWRNFKAELIEYGTELTQTDMKEYFRGNFFVNTHDILPTILQEGGRPAFQFRLVLAATMSSAYGMYSGFELCENTPVPGKEEYLNSEKYQYKVWDWDRPGNIVGYIARINAIRRLHPALQEYDNLRFFPSSDDNVLCYGKRTDDNADIIVVVVNLDPFHAHESQVSLPLGAFGMEEGGQYRATELLTDETFLWTGSDQHLRLDPMTNPAMIFSIEPWHHQEYVDPGL